MVQEKCTRLFVVNVNKNVRFRLNQQKEKMFFVKIVLLKESLGFRFPPLVLLFLVFVIFS